VTRITLSRSVTARSSAKAGRIRRIRRRIEPLEIDPIPLLEFRDQHPSDDEPRDHEEDVNPDESSAQANPGVVHHDQEHGDRSKTFDVGPATRYVTHNHCVGQLPPGLGHAAARSASSIIVTSWSKLVFGFHDSSLIALVGSPRR
jgi:hypothetical protein